MRFGKKYHRRFKFRIMLDTGDMSYFKYVYVREQHVEIEILSHGTHLGVTVRHKFIPRSVLSEKQYFLYKMRE